MHTAPDPYRAWPPVEKNAEEGKKMILMTIATKMLVTKSTSMTMIMMMMMMMMMISIAHVSIDDLKCSVRLNKGDFVSKTWLTDLFLKKIYI